MTHTQQFLSETSKIASKVDYGLVEKLASQLELIRHHQGRLFFIGLGGSAANCSHAVNDFRKLCDFEAYTPVDNVAELTAIANDEGWIGIFSRWLDESNVSPKDALFVLSVGGGTDEVSVPIKLAVNLATARGMKVFGIVGKKGGYTKELGDCVIVIPTVSQKHVTPHVEAFQSVILHCLVSHPLLQKNRTKW